MSLSRLKTSLQCDRLLYDMSLPELEDYSLRHTKKCLSLDDSVVNSSWVLAVYYFLFYALFKEDSQVYFQSVWGRGGIILIGHFPGVISGVGWLVGFTKTALAVDWCFILWSILYLGAGHVHQIILLVWPWNIVILLICFRCRHSCIKQEPGLTTTSTSIWTKRRQHLKLQQRHFSESNDPRYM